MGFLELPFRLLGDKQSYLIYLGSFTRSAYLVAPTKVG